MSIETDEAADKRLTEALGPLKNVGHDYVGGVIDGEVLLDGRFSPEILRKIADAIEGK